MLSTGPRDLREAVCDWLTANGVDPRNVPVDGELWVDTDGNGIRTLHAEQFETDASGRHVLNERRDEAARRQVAVPLVVEPPHWWQPHRLPTREQLLAAVSTVFHLHHRAEHHGQIICAHCSALDGQGTTDNPPVLYPCDTIKALPGRPEQETCPRCKGHGKVPDWSNWDEYHGEPKPKPCPGCTPAVPASAQPAPAPQA
jgi:hypothetical protein